MRKFALLLLLVLALASCRKQVVPKPDNLIPEDKMKDIIYDLSLLEAIRSQRPMSMETHNIDPLSYIYQKYDIDSIQFVESNKFYASDVARYKRIYESVDKRLETQKVTLEKQLKKSGQLPASSPDDPVVR